MNPVSVEALMAWGQKPRGRVGAKACLGGYGVEVFTLIFCLSLIIPLAIFAEIYFLNGRPESSQPATLELVNFLGTMPTPAPAGESLWMYDPGTPNPSGFTGSRAGSGSGYFRGSRGDTLKSALARVPRALIILMVFIFYQSSRTSSEEEPAFFKAEPVIL